MSYDAHNAMLDTVEKAAREKAAMYSAFGGCPCSAGRAICNCGLGMPSYVHPLNGPWVDRLFAVLLGLAMFAALAASLGVLQ